MLAQFFDLSIPIYERNIRVKINVDVNVDDNLTYVLFTLIDSHVWNFYLK